jgi:hypothetical protein
VVDGGLDVVVLYPDELGWLCEALTLNAGGDNPDDDKDGD